MTYEFPAPSKQTKDSIKRFLRSLTDVIERADNHSQITTFMYAPELTDEDLALITEGLLLAQWTTASLTRSDTHPAHVIVSLTKDWNPVAEEEGGEQSE